MSISSSNNCISNFFRCIFPCCIPAAKERYSLSNDNRDDPEICSVEENPSDASPSGSLSIPSTKCKGPVPLQNREVFVNNTNEIYFQNLCYVNAPMQVVMHSNLLKSLILRTNNVALSVFKQFLLQYENLSNPKEALSTESIRNIIPNCQFIRDLGYPQGDPDDLFCILRKELFRETGWTFIHRNFLTYNKTSVLTTKEEQPKELGKIDLELPKDDNQIDLIFLLQSYFCSENQMTIRDNFDDSKEVHFIKTQMEIWPQDLTIQLKRKCFDKSEYKRLEYKVFAEEFLRINQVKVLVPTTFKTFPEWHINGEVGNYQLDSFIVYKGTATEGHYSAYIIKSSVCYCCNDEKITTFETTSYWKKLKDEFEKKMNFYEDKADELFSDWDCDETSTPGKETSEEIGKKIAIYQACWEECKNILRKPEKEQFSLMIQNFAYDACFLHFHKV